MVARKQLLGRLIDVELSIPGILRGFGLKVGPVTRKGFDGRIAGSRGPAMRWCARRSMKPPMFCWLA